jgi:6-phosphofructokinase 2
MTDIVTLTMNPCVDVSTSTPRVQPIRKLRCSEPRREPGGGGINVARVLRRLGSDVLALHTAGGASGARLDRLLDDEQVPHLSLPIAGETRESFHVHDLESRQEYRFVMPGPSLGEAEWQAALERVLALQPPPAYWVLSGSLPPGVPEDFYARLARQGRAVGSRVVIDASGPALAAALREGVYLCKPSLGELRALTGEPLPTPAHWQAAARQLVAQGRAEVVVLSLGADGALLAARDLLVQAPALPVVVQGAIGAGDSLVGGMVHALAAGASLREAFAQGMAASAAAVLHTGTGLCRPEDVARLRPQVVLQDL